MGQVTELCTGKTGTLTTEEMTVVKFYAQDTEVLNSRKSTLRNCHLQESIVDLIIESIVYNNRAHIEINEDSFYIPVGNGTDVSLLKWLQAAEIPVHDFVKQKNDIILAEVPFSTDRKRSIVAVRHPLVEDTVRIYIKGAPELVL